MCKITFQGCGADWRVLGANAAWLLAFNGATETNQIKRGSETLLMTFKATGEHIGKLLAFNKRQYKILYILKTW